MKAASEPEPCHANASVPPPEEALSAQSARLRERLEIYRWLLATAVLMVVVRLVAQCARPT